MIQGLHLEPHPENLPKEDLLKGYEQNRVIFRPIKFESWIDKIFKGIENEDVGEEYKRLKKWIKMRQFYRGHQRGFFSPVTKTYQPINLDDYTPTEQSLMLINNQIRPKVRSLNKEWTKSQSRLHAQPTKNISKIKMAARYADSLLTMFQKKLIDERFSQREGKNNFLCGNYFRYSYWSSKDSKQKIKIPTYQDRDIVMGKQTWECQSCGDAGFPDELGSGNTCPECDKPVTLAGGMTRRKSVLTGYEEVKTGHPFTEQVDPTEIKIHLRARSIKTSPYLLRRRPIMHRLIKFEFPFSEIKSSDMSMASVYANEMETSIGNDNDGHGASGGEGESSKDGDFGQVEFKQLWLDLPFYYDVVLEEALELGSGDIIPAGTRLADRFPIGMYIARVGSATLDLKNESKNDHWTHGCYDILPESFWGDGLEDLIQNQQLINEIQSLIIENILHNASSKIIFNPRLINPELLTGRPREMTPMSNSARADSKPSDAFAQIEGMSITGEAHNAINVAKGDMTDQSGAYLSMSGGVDPKIQTATGMAIARDSGIGNLAPSLAIKANVEMEWGKQVLIIFQQNSYDDYEAYSGLLGNYSIAEAKAFAECDIETDIEIIAEAGSWMPRTDLEIRQDFLAFLSYGGLPLGFANPEIPQEIREKAESLFRVPVEFNKLQPDIRWANIRLEQLEATVTSLLEKKKITGTETEEAIVRIITKDIPIDLYIDDHEIYIDIYRKWKKTDRAIYLASPTEKSCVDWLIFQHQEAIQELSGEVEDKNKEDFVNEAAAQGTVAAVAGEMQGQPESQISPQDVPVEVGTGREDVETKPTSNSSKVTPPTPRE